MGKFYFLLFKAIYMGFFTGIVIAIPMGPAAFESVRWTLKKGLRNGILAALGILLSDAFDLLLINFGIFSLLEANRLLEAFFWIVSGLVVIFMGFRSIRKIKMENRIEKNLVKQDRTNPVLAGFIVNFSNPTTHFFWLTLSGTILRRWSSSGGLVHYTFILFLLFGMFTTLTAINYFASRGKKFSAPKHSARADRILAYVIMSFGVGFVVDGILRLIRLWR